MCGWSWSVEREPRFNMVEATLRALVRENCILQPKRTTRGSSYIINRNSPASAEPESSSRNNHRVYRLDRADTRMGVPRFGSRQTSLEIVKHRERKY